MTGNADWKDVADQIGGVMHLRHGFELLGREARDELARKLGVRASVFANSTRIYADPWSAEAQDTLPRVETSARFLGDLQENPDNFGVNKLLQFVLEEEGSMSAGELRLWMDLSHRIAVVLLERRKKTGGRVPRPSPETLGAWEFMPAATAKTQCIGGMLPSAYRATYPGKPFGGAERDGGTRAGPGFTFVMEAAAHFDIACTAEQVRDAMRTIRKQTSPPGET